MNTTYKNSVLICALLLLVGVGYGQSTKKKKKKKKKTKTEEVIPHFEQQSNSYAPFTPKERQEVVSPTKKIKKLKKEKSTYQKYNITMEQKVGEFKERMESNAKAAKKMRRKMRKPQYSDPSYFGHKRKPKIRKVKNRKYCKECGITH